MHNQDLGRVAVVARGTYDPSAEYERLDAVSYNGSSYLVRKHCQGVEPAEGEYYMLMAKAGDSTAANAAAEKALAAAERADSASGRANTAAGNAEQQAAAAGAAADSANAAAGNANTAAAGASSAKQKAETAAAAANNAAASANQNAEAAATATSAANAAASRADDAASGANTARDAAGAAAVAANAAAAAAQDVVDSVQPDMAQVKQTLSAHGEALDNRIKKFYTGNLGAVNIADSDDGAVRNLVIGGKSEQLHTNGYQLLNANVFDASAEYNGRKIVNNGDGSFTVTVSSDASDVTNLTLTNNPFLDVIPGTTYSYSGVENGCGIAFSLFDKDKKLTRYVGSASSNGTFTTSDGEVFFHIYVQSGSVVAGTYTIWLMLEKGATAHAWEPYTGGAPSPSPDYPQEIKSVENCAMTVSNADGTESQAAPIPVTLRGIGDVRDELYVYADGSGKLVQRVAVLKMADALVATESFQAVGANYRVWIDFNKSDRPAGYVLSKKKDLCTFLPCDAEYTRDYPHFYFDGGGLFVFSPASTKDELISNFGTQRLIYMLETPIETALTAEQVKALFDLRTYYGGTNISYQSDNGVEPVVNFDYACALENFVEYIKAAQGDDRKFIYDMDERMTDAEYVAALAYVNSEYAAALTELEV